MQETMTSVVELYPLKLCLMSNSGVYFHDQESDMLYQLKDNMRQCRCNFIGLTKTLDLEEDALIKKGTLAQLRKNGSLLHIIHLK